MFDKKELEQYCAEGKDIWDIMKLKDCSKTTVRNYLKKFNIKPPLGFHAKPGSKIGRPKGFSHPPEVKKALSEKFSGKGNPFYGCKHTDETKRKMSENHADFSGDKNPFKKALMRDESKRKAHHKRCQKFWKEKDENYRREFGRKRMQGHGDISGTFWARIKSNAKARNRQIEITIEYIWDLFLLQNRKCALSGLPIEFSTKFNENTASLDRIDNLKGYQEDNVQWVHKHINLMKRTLTEEQFITFCQAVSRHNPGKDDERKNFTGIDG